VLEVNFRGAIDSCSGEIGGKKSLTTVASVKKTTATKEGRPGETEMITGEATRTSEEGGGEKEFHHGINEDPVRRHGRDISKKRKEFKTQEVIEREISSEKRKKTCIRKYWG